MDKHTKERLITIYILVYLISLVFTYFADQGVTTTVAPLPLIKAVSGAFGPTFAVIWFINKKAWRWKWFRSITGLRVPYIHGRWEGFIKSSYTQHAKKHTVVIEIWQEIDNVRLWYFDENAITTSLIAGFYIEHEAAPPRLMCIYYNEPIKTSQKSLQPHQGVMDLVIYANEQRIKGIYYNNPHQRKTYGEIYLELKSRVLKKGFEDEA